MIVRSVTGFFLYLALLSQTTAVARETDQYNLPPVPLADVGAEIASHIQQRMGEAIAKLNKQIEARQKCLNLDQSGNRIKGCASLEQERATLAWLQSNEAVAQAVHTRLGYSLPPFTQSGFWLERHKFQNSPARFKTNLPQSIFAVYPIDYLVLAPTVNVYGSQFGTDKLDHVFETGYSYYRRYAEAVANGATDVEATLKVIRWGQKTERTIFGTLLSGVYSNGDLAANFAGLKFYQGLTREVRIGATARPAMLKLKNGSWQFNDEANLPDDLLKPFVSDHFNEALNPSIFANHFGLRAYVRRTVRRQSCKQWFEQRPGLSRAMMEQETQVLTSWHGENYGFTSSKHFVTIANTCFEND